MLRRDVIRAMPAAIAASMVAVTGALAPLHDAAAQGAYPTRPVVLIVPFAPGGLNDATARLWADKVRAPLGGAVVIDNRGGAGGVIGAVEASRARADGYTIFLGSSTTQVINPAIMAKPLYDPLKDFTAVSIFAVATAVIAVNPSVPAKTLTELAAYIKANPGKLSYGSAGTGSNSHLTGELFKQLAGGLDITHVPYKGGGGAVADLIAGHIPVASPHITGQLLDLHNSGKVRILAVASEKRLQGAPDLPTGAEAGMPGLIGNTFNGIFAPAGTPPEVVARIDAATQEAMKDEGFRQALIKAGFEPVAGVGGATAQRYVASEIERLTPLIKAGGFKMK